MKPDEIIYSNTIEKAKERLPNPKEIYTLYYCLPVFVYEPFPSMDIVKMITFKKVTLSNGDLSWEFDSIQN